MKTFWQLLKLASPLKGWMAVATLLGVFTVGASIGLMATSAYLISLAALHPSVAALAVAVVGVRFFGISRGVFRYLERYVSHHVTFKLLARLRIWFYQALEPLAPARLLHYKSGDLLARIVSDIETLQNFFVRVIAPTLTAAIIGIVMWFFLGAYNLSFALVFIGFYLLAGVGVPVMAHVMGRKTAKEIIVTRAALKSQLVDGVQGVAELVAFGQEEAHQIRIQTLNAQLINQQKRMAWLNGLETTLSNLIMNLTAWVMLIVAIPMVQSGQLDGIFLALLLLSAIAAFEAVLPLPQTFQHLGSSLASANRLFEIIGNKSLTTKDVEYTAQKNKNASPMMRHSSLELKNLSFRYNAGEPYALHDFSLSLPPKKRVAIVGSSGAGKSTLINLLVRFWDYQEGEIKLNGRDLKEFSQDELFNIFGVVEQRTHLFNTTIKDNVNLARPSATEAEIIIACQQAQIHDFIQSLPQGYNTRIGEQGLRLSGGECQRLAIARALLRSAPILVLDEPTANLDSANEQAVLVAIRNATTDHTTILITHRLLEMETYDEIIVLKEGEIAERGTHARLLQQEGLYWQMVRATEETRVAEVPEKFPV
jgi:ATP-binding cassette subfamily C protein CydC